MKNVIRRIKGYRELKADIIDIDLKLQELDDELGPSSIGYEERTGNTYKITSSVENQAEKLIEDKEKLLKIKTSKEREIARIDNAMTVLTEDEFDIIRTIHIEHEKWWKLEQKYNRSYRALKYIEEFAVKKMVKYLA